MMNAGGTRDAFQKGNADLIFVCGQYHAACFSQALEHTGTLLFQAASGITDALAVLARGIGTAVRIPLRANA